VGKKPTKPLLKNGTDLKGDHNNGGPLRLRSSEEYSLTDLEKKQGNLNLTTPPIPTIRKSTSAKKEIRKEA